MSSRLFKIVIGGQTNNIQNVKYPNVSYRWPLGANNTMATITKAAQRRTHIFIVNFFRRRRGIVELTSFLDQIFIMAELQPVWKYVLLDEQFG